MGINVARRVIVALMAAPITAVALMLAFNQDWLRSALVLALAFAVWRFDSLRLVARKADNVDGVRA